LGFQVVPNPTLRPEQAWACEVGHISPRRFGFWRRDAGACWTEARDLLEPHVLLSPPDTVLLPPQTVVRARLAGLDASIVAAPIPQRLTATLGYTYLDTHRRVTNDSASGEIGRASCRE